MEFWLQALQVLVLVFVLVFGLGLLTIVVLYLIDRNQTEDAIRRNYPVIGRFRSLFTELGEFFRQYFFAMDREEMPFNRAQRNWVYNASLQRGNTVAFGSTRNLNVPGTPIFMNAVFPPLDDQYASTEPMVIGPYCRHPYSAESIFHISGMSYGAISKPAIEALGRGAKEAGIWMNTGEGGVSPYHLATGCDIVFQIGTAKFGVRDEHGNLSDEKLREVAAHPEIKMFEIKLSQGAKPGKGGILPAAKIDEEVAQIRGVPMGQDAISPNRHKEVHDYDGLLDLIAHVREVTGKPVGIKTCIGSADPWFDFFVKVRERGVESAPDFITVDGGEGGTGAAPMPLIDLVGLPLREALIRMVDLRDLADLHDRIRIVASGKMVAPGDVAWAICLGADFIVSARGFMFSLGCIQALKCNKNTCPTGITTHIPSLQKGLVVEDKEKRVAAYAQAVTHEVETIAHSVGVAEPRQMRRRHVRIVQDDGRSVQMNELYPSVKLEAEGLARAGGNKVFEDALMRLGHV
ncbi:MAG: FMN-binding glutamate synthase family protein [Pseudomonadota bacterium]